MARGEVICVTGASGFIGSWVVRLLLLRGYAVHATVQNLEDEKETKHLEAMERAESRLRLFQMDLIQYDSVAAAVDGAAGVIHLASPCFITEPRDPQRELLEPAVKGTINVLTAAKELGIRRVVVTSSLAAMVPDRSRFSDVIRSENCWTDEGYCKNKGLWYPLSKILAEKAAWKFAEANHLDIVVVNPGAVLGPIIPPSLNSTMLITLQILEGNGSEVPEDLFMGYVHVKDAALAHILVYENASATGRYVCIEALSQYDDIAAKIAELYPEYQITRLGKDTQPTGQRRTKDASKKLVDLGLEFIPLDQIIKDSVESLRSKGTKGDVVVSTSLLGLKVVEGSNSVEIIEGLKPN